MSNIIIYFISFILFNSALFLPTCEEGTNNCQRCDPITKLCTKCILDIYSPDNNGGCSPSEKCIIGKNYCIECDKEEKFCSNCESGLFPDENGACSFVGNCKISYKGACLECKDNFILIGGEKDTFKICKFLGSEDLLNCQSINNITGLCDVCETNYFLNKGDLKCTKTEKCYESRFGKCIFCNDGYYLDKKEEKCFSQNGEFLLCRESVDGKKCDVCLDDCFLDENNNCVAVNYCADGKYFGCNKCVEGYYLTFDGFSCTKEQNCFNGDKITGLCNSCLGDYYINLDDRTCNSNQEDNDFKNCKMVENGKCLTCDFGFNLSDDGKCTISNNCAEVDKGACLQCSEGFYLTLDNRCTTTEHCLYIQTYDECIECEDGYYYNQNEKACLKFKEGYENCKSATYDGEYCLGCKNGFYLNQTDRLCYSNKEKNNYYKCTMTDTTGSYCGSCENDYYIGYKDHKCSKIEGCDISENEEKCLECDEIHCLNVKTGNCIKNEKIKNEEEKFYYRCNRTNEEGNACAVCLDGYELSDKGLCVDKIHCSVEKDGVCVKCKNNKAYSSCLNSDFGCVPTDYMICIECDNNLDFDICTKCPEYFKLNNEGICIDIDDDE